MHEKWLVTVALCAQVALAACTPGASPSGNDDDGDDGPSAAPSDADSPPKDHDAAGPPVSVAVNAAPAAGCQANAWAAGATKTIQLSHGGRNRTYIVHVGSSVGAHTPAPLLLNFHGLTSSAMIQLYYSGTNQIADQHGLVVAYPEGVSSSFNAIGCCGTASQQNVDDVGFARAIVEDVAAHVCTDRKRVYATGMSNGGFMTYRLACSASDVFAAVAPVAGALASPSCTPARPVPVIAFHGDADQRVSYASDQQSVAAFRTKNGCTGQATRTMHGSAYCDRWSPCAGGSAVEMCTFPGLGHAWPMASTGWAATPALWTFLSSYTLP